MAIRNSAEAVLARVNAANGLNLTISDVYIADVQPTTTAEATAHDGADTKALIRAYVDSPAGFAGEAWVYYTRLPFDQAVTSNGSGSPFGAGGIFTATQLCTDYIAPANGLKFLRSDFIPTNLSNATGLQSVNMQPSYKSCAYSPGTAVPFYFNRDSNTGTLLAGAVGPQYSMFAHGKVGKTYNGSPMYLYGSTVASATSVSITSGALPPGLTMGVSGRLVYLSGTPTTAGTYTFTFKCGALTQSRTVVIGPSSLAEWTSTFQSTSTDGLRLFANMSQTMDYGKGIASNNLMGSKSYFIFAIEEADGVMEMELGLTDENMPMDGTAPSSYANAVTLLQANGCLSHNGNLVRAILTNPNAPGAWYSDAYYIGFAVDATDASAIKVWVHRNGTYISGHNPENGEPPLYTFDNSGHQLKIFAGLTDNTGGYKQGVRLYQSTSICARFRPAPSGFSCRYS